MAITTNWSVNQMTHEDSDGGVILVYWSCVAASDGDPSYSATEGGKLRLNPDPSSPDYIPYANLTENDVLGWVYNSLIEGDETADEARLASKPTVQRRCKARLTEQQRNPTACLGRLPLTRNF